MEEAVTRSAATIFVDYGEWGECHYGETVEVREMQQRTILSRSRCRLIHEPDFA